MEDYSESNALVPYGQTLMKTDLDDEIRLYRPKKKNERGVLFSACLRLWRFLLMVTAFFLIYFCLYQLYVNNASADDDIQAFVPPEETGNKVMNVEKEFAPALLINESKIDIDGDAIFNEGYDFCFPNGDGVKVIIVNTHSSEKVSSEVSVRQFSEDLLKILQSRGISAYFDDTRFDEQGSMGAYTRMSEKVKKMRDIYNEAVVVIDLHDSDSGAPLTFTVGSDESYAWQENLRFACYIYKKMKCNDGAIRILPSSLGQDNGLLSINVGIGGVDYSGIEAREMLSVFADAISEILKTTPHAEGLFAYISFNSAFEIPVLETITAIISSVAEYSPDTRILVFPVSR
jgi:hypothetical protein